MAAPLKFPVIEDSVDGTVRSSSVSREGRTRPGRVWRFGVRRPALSRGGSTWESQFMPQPLYGNAAPGAGGTGARRPDGGEKLAEGSITETGTVPPALHLIEWNEFPARSNAPGENPPMGIRGS